VSNITTNGGYSDFKLVAAVSHKDIFYVNSSGGPLFVIYAITDNGFVIESSNLMTQPASFLTDFPNAIALSSTLGLS